MDIGAELRRAREARGLSVAALAATTRIQPRVLDGIERNDLSVIPPRPYARGFVAAYAREVGLNPDHIVRAYFAQFEVPDLRSSGDAPEERDAAPAARGSGAMAFVLVTALVIVGAVMLWEPDAVIDPGAEVVGTTGTAAAAPAGLEPAVNRPAELPARPVAHAAAPIRQDLVAVLQAERPAWVAATADGERVLYRIVQAGAIETVRARREITIRVGDAGAVRLSVNGGPAELMGRSGQVRDVTLGAAR